MKRHQVYFVVLFVFIALYCTLYYSMLTYPELSQFVQSQYGLSYAQAMFWIQVAPWYALICFGCYCLTKLGIDLLTFRDCPQEIPKLAKEIEQAREDLKRRGYKAPIQK